MEIQINCSVTLGKGQMNVFNCAGELSEAGVIKFLEGVIIRCHEMIAAALMGKCSGIAIELCMIRASSALVDGKVHNVLLASANVPQQFG